MRSRTVLSAVFVTIVLTATLFYLFQQELAGSWLTFGVHPEVVAILESSLDNQKELAQLRPETAGEYRRQFEKIQGTLSNLRILAHNRDVIIARTQAVLLGVFCAGLLIIGFGSVWRDRRRETRLDQLQGHLRELSLGRAGIVIDDRRRDIIGRIAAMIEETSRVMATDRARLATLQHLGVWQEAAQRQAHEMRTPLTGIKMEIERLRSLLHGNAIDNSAEVEKRIDSACEEIDRLTQFASNFTSFARLPEPRPKNGNLDEFLAEFRTTYSDAWPNLELRHQELEGATALFDRDMLRQVLVNLCDNSAAAMGERRGIVTLTAEKKSEAILVRVSDNGPGVASVVRAHLFEPYVTTRPVGEGMGLGLAISKKILLDHGGDLELESSSRDGSVFRLTLWAEQQGTE